MSAKKTLVIIVSHNSAEYIGDCLLSLEGAVTSPRLLIVDNASIDTTVAIARQTMPDAIIIEQKTNLGFAEGNNVGIRYAIENSFEYVYLLNHDTEVTPDFLTKALSVVESDSAIAAVQSKLLLFDDKAKINSIGNVQHYLGFGWAGGHGTPDHPTAVTDIAYPSGAGVLLRVSGLQHVGMFRSEFFMYHEDLDLGWRLRLAGHRVVIAPESIVYHKYHFSRNKNKWYYMERNRYLTLLYNYRLSTLILLKPIWLLMEIGSLLFAIVDGWGWQKIRAIGYILNPHRWSAIRLERKKIRALRKVSDREVMKLFANTIDSSELRSPVLRYIANPLTWGYWKVIQLLIR